MNKRISGTKEWSNHSVNCVQGCEHNCLYCYARYNAINRWQTVKPNEWTNEKILEKQVNKSRGLKKGVTMFPTTHDITPNTLDACMTVMYKLLKAGNQLLIVSKPHIECVVRMCEEFEEYKDQILFRFTIGGKSEEVLSYWEPNAPCYGERLACLKLAYLAGYKTSVSCEPLLEYTRIEEMVKDFEPYVTDAIWIGKLNHIRERVDTKGLTGISAMYAYQVIYDIEENQTDEMIFLLYDKLKDNPKIKWKESYKEVIDIDSPNKEGMDI